MEVHKAVSVDNAKKWTKEWRDTHPNQCKAFLIPVRDLVNTLMEMDVLERQGDGHYTIDEGTDKGIRAYMAIDTSVTEGHGEKLLLVATNKTEINGKVVHQDIIYLGPTSPHPHTKLQESGVYDFTHPCPNTCDEDSPLS